MTTSPVITSEIQKLAPGAIIELFVLDTTNLNGDISYFHSGTNGLHQNIIWQGQEYTRYPVEASGFEYSGNGQIPRPKMVVSNAFGAITALILELGNDLIGSKIIRRRTLAKCLDAANFPGNVNPDADPTVEWPEEIYFVDRKVSEGQDVVEFELATASDLQGIAIPKRQIIQNLCPFVYREADCGYSGPPTFDFDDNAMTTATTTEGQLLLDKYQVVLSTKQIWIDSVAATQLAKQEQEVGCSVVKLESIFTSVGGFVPPKYGVVTDTRGTVLYAMWNGVRVSLGGTYRIGVSAGIAYVKEGNNFGGSYTSRSIGFVFQIERWGVDSGVCATKTGIYNSAVAAQAVALANYQTATAEYNAAFADLPSDDPLYSRDVCGKRVTSCKARFGIDGENNPISFGGFPSASLIK